MACELNLNKVVVWKKRTMNMRLRLREVRNLHQVTQQSLDSNTQLGEEVGLIPAYLLSPTRFPQPRPR